MKDKQMQIQIARLMDKLLARSISAPRILRIGSFSIPRAISSRATPVNTGYSLWGFSSKYLLSSNCGKDSLLNTLFNAYPPQAIARDR